MIKFKLYSLSSLYQLTNSLEILMPQGVVMSQTDDNTIELTINQIPALLITIDDESIVNIKDISVNSKSIDYNRKMRYLRDKVLILNGSSIEGINNYINDIVNDKVH